MFLLFSALSHPTLGVPDRLTPRWRLSCCDPSLLNGFGLRRVDYLAQASFVSHPSFLSFTTHPVLTLTVLRSQIVAVCSFPQGP